MNVISWWAASLERLLGRHSYGSLWPDRLYAQRRYLDTFGRPLDLRNPATFNEKIQWLKLYDRRPVMATVADKYAVRQYVLERIGEEYLNPLLALCSSVDELLDELPGLPKRFVVKATHGSGWNVIVKENAVPLSGCLEQIDGWLSTNYFDLGREWCYEAIPPKLVCEQFIQPMNAHLGLLDYKFLCFHGLPAFVQVDVNRFTGHRRNIYDLSWNLLPVEYVYDNSKKEIPQPDHLHEMIEVAQRLSEDFLFVRVDLYSEDRVIFGEMTFYPENGFGKFRPECYDREFGKRLQLPTRLGLA